MGQSDRRQYVSVNGSNSSCISVACGAHQGSVLGPVLWLIYINDIYYESNNLEMLQRTVNKELKKVKMWLDVSKLSLNIDKANFTTFKSPRRSVTEAVSIKRKSSNQANLLCQISWCSFG